MTELNFEKLNGQYEYYQNKLIRLYTEKDKLVAERVMFTTEAERKEKALRDLQEQINKCAVEVYSLYEIIEKIKKAGLSKSKCSDPATIIIIHTVYL
jgi:chromosome segregation ATPase